MSDLTPIEYYPTNYTEIAAIEFVGVGSGHPDYNYVPILRSETELTENTSPQFVAIYISNEYVESCDPTAMCNSAVGWYVFGRDAIVSGDVRYATPTAWPTGANNNSGILSVHEQNVPDSLHYHCVFLDSYVGANGSGGTDTWTAPVPSSSSPSPIGDYSFRLSRGAFHNLHEWTLEDAFGGNAGYKIDCEIQPAPNEDEFTGDIIRFNFDPDNLSDEEEDMITPDPSPIFDSLIEGQSTATWGMNDNVLNYVDRPVNPEGAENNIFGVASNNPSMLVFKFADLPRTAATPDWTPLEIFTGISSLQVGPTRKFTTIQSAIDASFNGYTILVDDGVYREAINFKGKEITLRGNVISPENCIIDGQNEDGTPVQAPDWSRPSWDPTKVSIVTVDTREPGDCYDGDAPNELESGPDSALDFERIMEGFTIRNGTSGTRYPSIEPGCEPCIFTQQGKVICECPENCFGPDAPINCTDDQCPGTGIDAFVGGGIWIYRSYLTVNNCVFTNNSSDGGGGAFVRESNVVFLSCDFDSNTSGSNGGGLQLNHTISNVIRCNFTNNQIVPLEKAPSSGSGAGIHVFSGTCTLNTCTITDNHATENGGGISMALIRTNSFEHLFGDVNVNDCVIENNTSSGDDGCGGLQLNSTSQDGATPDAKLILLRTTICNNVRGEDSILSNFCINATSIPEEDMWDDNGGNVICAEAAIEINAVVSPDGFEAGIDTVDVAVEVEQGELDSIQYQWYIEE